MNDHDLDLALRAMGIRRTRVSVSPSLRARVHAVPLGTIGDGGSLPHVAWRFLDVFSATRLAIGGVIAGVVGIVFLASTVTAPTPAIPGASPSSSPAQAIHWTTPLVDLVADAFVLETGDLEFTYGEGTPLSVGSVPLGPDRWTLETVWTEHDRDQRFTLSFASDGTDWWVDEIRTTIDPERDDWIHADGPFFRAPLGEVYAGDVRIDLQAEGPLAGVDPRVAGVLTIEGMRLATDPRGFEDVAAAASPVTTVSLGLYSGRPDPSWQLSEEESAALTALLESLPRVDGSPPSGGLGYHGFLIERLTPEGDPRLLVAFDGTVSDPASSHLSYLDDPDRSVERFLLESGRDQLSAVELMAPGLDLEPMPSPGSAAATSE